MKDAKTLIRLDKMIYDELKVLLKKKPEALIKERYEKYRKIDAGAFS